MANRIVREVEREEPRENVVVENHEAPRTGLNAGWIIAIVIGVILLFLLIMGAFNQNNGGNTTGDEGTSPTGGGTTAPVDDGTAAPTEDENTAPADDGAPAPAPADDATPPPAPSDTTQ